METTILRIIIVDDDERIRDALTLFFETRDEFALVGQAAHGVEAIQLCERLQPDIVLMDLKMPVMDGMTATRKIHERFPHISIIVLTNSSDGDHIKAALQAGASGCVLKSANVDQLVRKLRAYGKRLRLPALYASSRLRLPAPYRNGG